MYTDRYGKTWVKLAFHQHSTRSDGRATPEEIVRLYREAGYDAVALTDHWVQNGAEVIDGMPILPGCEYHVVKSGKVDRMQDSTEGIYHIVGLCYERTPRLEKDLSLSPQTVIDAIGEAGGLAVLAHPAWSFNTPEQIARLHGIDAVEIYNTTSSAGNNRRPDSSVILDQLAAHHGIFLPISGADDAHRYTTPIGRHPDYCTTFVMAECDSVEPEAIKGAIRERRFYTSQGPEIRLTREGNRFLVDCSPVSEIVFFSNFVVDANATLEGDGLTHFAYETQREGLKFVRAMVIDADGKMAWSQYMTV
ncbi:MAG: hypothetical protein E7637_08480 [Ruminococcaceae bacterium]|nr:hypothetical protein [Oscillospiraceae bacterium]